MAQTHPLIGTAVWVRKDDKVLLAKRAPQKKSGAGEWCPPGGHLEMHETIEQCAVRETKEEAGIEIGNISLLRFEEDTHQAEDKHYVTFHFTADFISGDPRPLEGESEEWHWFLWDELPEPLFRPARIFVEKGYNPFTS